MPPSSKRRRTTLEATDGAINVDSSDALSGLANLSQTRLIRCLRELLRSKDAAIKTKANNLVLKEIDGWRKETLLEANLKKIPEEYTKDRMMAERICHPAGTVGLQTMAADKFHKERIKGRGPYSKIQAIAAVRRAQLGAQLVALGEDWDLDTMLSHACLDKSLLTAVREIVPADVEGNIKILQSLIDASQDIAEWFYKARRITRIADQATRPALKHLWEILPATKPRDLPQDWDKDYLNRISSPEHT